VAVGSNSKNDIMGHIKAKTHLETLGFSETDKKDPNHDKIQEWDIKTSKQ